MGRELVEKVLFAKAQQILFIHNNHDSPRLALYRSQQPLK
jgi:hypothetical protein